MLNASGQESLATINRYCFAGAVEYLATLAPTAEMYRATASSSFGVNLTRNSSASHTSASPLKMSLPLCGFGANGVFAVRAEGGVQVDCAGEFMAVASTNRTTMFAVRNDFKICFIKIGRAS